MGAIRRTMSIQIEFHYCGEVDHDDKEEHPLQYSGLEGYHWLEHHGYANNDRDTGKGNRAIKMRRTEGRKEGWMEEWGSGGSRGV